MKAVKALNRKKEPINDFKNINFFKIATFTYILIPSHRK